LKGKKPLPVIKRIRAWQPEGLKEFGRLQNDTKTDELMMEDLGKYVIKNDQIDIISQLTVIYIEYKYKILTGSPSAKSWPFGCPYSFA
jgi:hypothetical protein